MMSPNNAFKRYVSISINPHEHCRLFRRRSIIHHLLLRGIMNALMIAGEIRGGERNQQHQATLCSWMRKIIVGGKSARSSFSIKQIPLQVLAHSNVRPSHVWVKGYWRSWRQSGALAAPHFFTSLKIRICTGGQRDRIFVQERRKAFIP